MNRICMYILYYTTEYLQGSHCFKDNEICIVNTHVSFVNLDNVNIFELRNVTDVYCYIPGVNWKGQVLTNMGLSCVPLSPIYHGLSRADSTEVRSKTNLKRL